MNVHLPTQMSKAAFIDWMDRQEGRYELVRGRVVMMPGVSRRHALIVRNLMLALHGQLDPKRWEVIAEFGLDAEPQTLRYPDILVEEVGGKGGDRTAISPVLLAEVLSSSAAGVDLGDKAAEYLKLATVQAYLVFSQDESKAWAWLRGKDGFSPGPQVFEGDDARIAVDALGIFLRLNDLYRGLPEN